MNISRFRLKLIDSWLAVFLGFFAIIAPHLMTLSVEIMTGTILFISGLSQCFYSFYVQPMKFRWNTLFIGMLYLFCGVLFLRYPAMGVFSLTYLLLSFILAEGIVKGITAFQLYPAPGWLWLILNSVLSVLLACYIWADLPEAAAWTLGLWAGINLLLYGISQLGSLFYAQNKA